MPWNTPKLIKKTDFFTHSGDQAVLNLTKKQTSKYKNLRYCELKSKKMQSYGRFSR